MILLFVSPNYLDSDYCYDIEMPEALRRRTEEGTRVIPVILTSFPFEDEPFAELTMVPTDGKPLDTWANRNKGAVDAARGIIRVIEEVIAEREQQSVPAVRAMRPRGK